MSEAELRRELFANASTRGKNWMQFRGIDPNAPDLVDLLVREYEKRGGGDVADGRSLRSRLQGTSVSSETTKQIKAELRRLRKQEEERKLHESPEWKREMAAIDAEVDAQIAEKEERQAQERRDRLDRARAPGLGMVAAALRTTPPQEPQPVSSVKVKGEPLVYGPGGGDILADQFRYVHRFSGSLIPGRGDGSSIGEVEIRLATHRQQVAEWARSDNENLKLARRYTRALNRPFHGSVSDHSDEDFRNLVFPERHGEVRAVSTGSGSMGDFTPPLFLLPKWAEYMTNAAPALSQSDQPDFGKTKGMKFEIPVLSSTVGVQTQSSENSSVLATGPTASYLTANVQTAAVTIPISQQTLDRSGPGQSITDVLFEQSWRETATIIDAAIVDAVNAVAGDAVTNNGTPGIPTLWDDIGKAAGTIASTPGTNLIPSTLLLPPLLAGWYMSARDSTGRPIWEPSAAATLARAGQVNTRSEGYLGRDVAGAMAFADNNLPTTNSGADGTIMLGDFQNGVVAVVDPPIMECWPEYEAAALTAAVTFRCYYAVVVTRPNAFATFTGSAYPASPTWANA